MKKKIGLIIFTSLAALILLAGLLVLFIPRLRESVTWRLNEYRIRIDYALNPPEEAVFVPDADSQPTPLFTQTPSPTLIPSLTPTQLEITNTPQPTITPFPAAVMLTGIKYQDQHGLWNYCAPANLAMALSYWGWEGDRMDTGNYLKPFEKDKNVMLYEMAEYVNTQTNLKAIVRTGGTLELLKKLIAAGYPTLVEKGVFIRDVTGKNSWMGHYAVVSGYDDSANLFLTQDSYFQPDYPVEYEQLFSQWRGFNYLFLITYKPEQEEDLFKVLGDYKDEATADRIAYEKANQEIYQTEGIDLFFAWYNRGTNMVYLQDYAGAADSFDQAFQVYGLIPDNQRPWRTTWYRTEAYAAYYFVGRYQDVINLATLTINNATEPYLEENFFWRARAYLAVGQTQKALDDVNQALEYHPGYAPALSLLDQIGSG